MTTKRRRVLYEDMAELIKDLADWWFKGPNTPIHPGAQLRDDDVTIAYRVEDLTQRLNKEGRTM